MKLRARLAVLAAMALLAGCATQGGGGGTAPASSGGSADAGISLSSNAGSGAVPPDSGVRIVQPATMADVRSPVEVCMETKGYTVEPAKNGVNPGRGHHHLLIDQPLPDPTQPIPKDDSHVHMGDGSTCKSLTLSKGLHTITAVFAQGNHVPYDPPVTHSVTVEVK